MPLPSISADLSSGVSGPVTSGASSGSVPAVASLSAPGASPDLVKYGLIAAGAVILVLVLSSALRRP